MKKTITKLLVILLSASFISGCTFIFQVGRRSDSEKIDKLSKQVDQLSKVKSLLEQRLAQEIQDKQVSLKMSERGLVITFLADILFDSGKNQIKTDAYPILNKVARILQENVPDLKVGIEGHTDNVPIKFSGWKSNWELSTARGLSVLHYLVDEKGVSPERISAIGYGEHSPVSSNSSAEGRKLNRRVEVVIYPKVTKVRGEQNPEEKAYVPSGKIK
ncbi:MAG: OmpA family protein [Candidatus Omnitrophica bacterium]|jgi:chemotaxis protein MotB|nr:OmpA family protein [Candidatus Omnitrophota bacterium]